MAVVFQPQKSQIRILRVRAVMALVGLSLSSIYRLKATGDFPKPVKLGRQAVGWRSDVIQEWLAGRPES